MRWKGSPEVSGRVCKAFLVQAKSGFQWTTFVLDVGYILVLFFLISRHKSDGAFSDTILSTNLTSWIWVYFWDTKKTQNLFQHVENKWENGDK